MTHAEKLLTRVRNRQSYEGLPGTMPLDECVPPISWPKVWLEEAITAAVAEEREACAQLASDSYGDKVGALGPDEPKVVGLKIAAAIRARQGGQ